MLKVAWLHEVLLCDSMRELARSFDDTEQLQRKDCSVALVPLYAPRATYPPARPPARPYYI